MNLEDFFWDSKYFLIKNILTTKFYIVSRAIIMK
jgi:hypothetical protein